MSFSLRIHKFTHKASSQPQATLRNSFSLPLLFPLYPLLGFIKQVECQSVTESLFFFNQSATCCVTKILLPFTVGICWGFFMNACLINRKSPNHSENKAVGWYSVFLSIPCHRFTGLPARMKQARIARIRMREKVISSQIKLVSLF